MIEVGSAVTFQVDDESKRRFGTIVGIGSRQNGFFTVYKIIVNGGNIFEIHQITNTKGLAQYSLVEAIDNVQAAANGLHFIMTD